MFGAFGNWEPVSISMIKDYVSRQHLADVCFKIVSRGKKQNDHARHHSLEYKNPP